MWVSTTRLAPARLACSPASAAVRWPRGPSRSGRGKVASMISRSVSRAISTSSSLGPQSAP